MTTTTSEQRSDKGYRPGESFKTGAEAKRNRLGAYVDWLLTPEEAREPKTKTAFAEQWGVTTQTLRNDEREPFVQRTLAERARAGFKALDLPRVIQTLTEIAVGDAFIQQKGQTVRVTNSASVSAAKVLLDWAEKTSALREEQVDYGDLTESELVEMAIAILNKASED